MKYIRLKDSIICEEDTNKALSSLGERERDYAMEGDVADSIKELCDKCVIVFKNDKIPFDMSFYEAEYFIDAYVNKIKSMNPIIAIYGAIWCDFGLKYVAKMNAKGKLQLL